MRFSQSTHLLMFLSLENLTFIIRTGLPILVELIDLVNSYNFSQMTLTRWSTFLLGFQTVILIALLFWIYFFPLMLVFVLQWLEKCGLFSDFQYGFRSSRSTADLLTTVSDRIARAFNGSGAT